MLAKRTRLSDFFKEGLKAEFFETYEELSEKVNHYFKDNNRSKESDYTFE